MVCLEWSVFVKDSARAHFGGLEIGGVPFEDRRESDPVFVEPVQFGMGKPLPHLIIEDQLEKCFSVHMKSSFIKGTYQNARNFMRARGEFVAILTQVPEMHDVVVTTDGPLG